MQHPVLEATVRKETGKSAAHKIRREGKVPGVLYGRGEQNETVAVDSRELERLLYHGLTEHGMLDLEVRRGHKKEQKTVLMREIQHHPVSGRILHVDFYHVEMDQQIHSSIPVVLVGQSEGARKGGTVEHVLREIDISCVARKMPETVVLDIAALDLGQSYHVRDLALDEDIEVLTDPNRTVVSVLPPKLVVEEAPEAEVIGEEEAEPELVGKEEEAEERGKEERPERRER